MKIKPTSKSGGVVVHLGPQETQLPATPPEQSSTPLPTFNLKKILVPVDFSECSKKALQYAIPFAKQFNAELTLLHVVQPYLPVPEMTTVDVDLIQREMCAAGEKELEALRQSIVGEVSSKTALKVGSPHFEIIEAAKNLGVDLIILSTHGRGGLAHVFLGSTAERVVRHASCPILVVREREHEFVTASSARTGG